MVTKTTGSQEQSIKKDRNNMACYWGGMEKT